MLYNTILGHVRALEAHHWQVSNLYILPTMHLYFSCLCFAARNHGSKAKKVSSVALWWCQNVNFISQACITRTNHRQHIYSPFCNCLLAAVVSYQKYWWSTVGFCGPWILFCFCFLPQMYSCWPSVWDIKQTQFVEVKAVQFFPLCFLRHSHQKGKLCNWL